MTTTRTILQRVLIVTIPLCAVLYLAACAAMLYFQRSLLYFPQPCHSCTSQNSTIFTVDGTPLVLSVRPHDGSNALLYFGGNGEDVSASLATISAAFPDRAIYAMHYRGYGGSGGKPSEPALQGDALALFDSVHRDYANIMLIGRSLGSGIAVRIASQRHVSRLVLVTPFDSILSLAAQRYPYLPVTWLLLDTYESWRYAPAVTAPTLVVAAQFDQLVPADSTEKLYRRFNKGVASKTVIPNVDHNSIADSVGYGRVLAGDDPGGNDADRSRQAASADSSN